MPFSGLRVPFIVIFGAIALLALFAGQTLYERHAEAALRDALLQIDGVMAVEVQKDQVQVKLAQVSDLSETFSQIRQVTKASPGAAIVQDNPDGRLKRAWDQIQFAVYEAAGRENFRVMAATVDQEARAQGIRDYRVTIDNAYIYVQLIDGEHYLYRIIPRQPTPPEGASSKGASLNG